MTGLEIFLIILGLIIVFCSYIFSEHLQSKKTECDIDISAAINTEDIKKQIDDQVSTIVDDTVEKTEVMLDKVSNEKIMAVSEYSDKVLDEISKTHNEVMFLYNMLGDKETEIKDHLKDINSIKSEINDIRENLDSVPDNDIVNDIMLETDVIIDEDEQMQANNNSVILDLYNQGKSIIEIAKELGIGIGEVRLVVDLFNSNIESDDSREAQ